MLSLAWQLIITVSYSLSALGSCRPMKFYSLSIIMRDISLHVIYVARAAIFVFSRAAPSSIICSIRIQQTNGITVQSCLPDSLQTITVQAVHKVAAPKCWSQFISHRQ